MTNETGRLRDKVALITGGGQGIGRAAALLFAEEGAAVVVADINRESGQATAEEILGLGGKGGFRRTDVSRSDEVQALMEWVDREQGRLDVLYNNASVFLPGRDGPITEISEESWDRVLAVNLKSIYLCCRYGIPLMLRGGGGSIINTASSAAVIGIPGCDAYTATKGATVSLSRSLAVEYRPKNIRVNCIAPAGIQTPMLGYSNLEDSTFDEKRFLALRTPSRRYGRPEEIARLALFLASEEASYINGAVIVADGGITINGDLSRLEEE
ncbi:MAG: glucose 1-dehydrogenase [Spirochaetales bacterium]|nr:glucose 1-dehydrogenase [Spirochaetales bacterium]